MSTYLISSGSTLRLDHYVWQNALVLAQIGGWNPAGTFPPENYYARPFAAPWEGDYQQRQGEIVIAADAWALAEALSTMLDDIPDERTGIPRPAQPTMSLFRLAQAKAPPNPFEFWAGKRAKRQLRDLIAFCRENGFEIH